MRAPMWLWVVIPLQACGGSASETPPPVPPSREEIIDAAKRDQERAAAEAKAAEAAQEGSTRTTSLPEVKDERRPAPRTWGGGDQLRLK